MTSAARIGHCATARPRTARKPHHCLSCYPLRLTIAIGDRYLEHKEFPGGESGYADSAKHPVRAAECEVCARRNGRGDLLDGAAGTR